MIIKSKTVSIEDRIREKYPNCIIRGINEFSIVIYFNPLGNVNRTFIQKILGVQEQHPDCEINEYGIEVKNITNANILNEIFPEENIVIVKSYRWYDWSGY